MQSIVLKRKNFYRGHCRAHLPDVATTLPVQPAPPGGAKMHHRRARRTVMARNRDSTAARIRR
jgi:hypothetical protein